MFGLTTCNFCGRLRIRKRMRMLTYYKNVAFEKNVPRNVAMALYFCNKKCSWAHSNWEQPL